MLKARQQFNEMNKTMCLRFGMVPELVGRFPVLVPFHALTEDMLKQILTEPKNNIVDQSKKLFSLDGINLE